MRFILVASALIAAASVVAATCGQSGGVCPANQHITVPSNVVAWYPAGVSDVSATDNDLTTTGGTSTDGNGCGDLTFTAASSQYASAAFNAAYPLSNAARSFFAWVKADPGQQPTPSTDVVVAAYGNLGSQNQAFILGLQNNGGVFTWFFSQWGDQIASASNAVFNTWTHIGVTYDGATINLYIDGVFSSSKAFDISKINTASGPILVGGTSGFSRYFGGDINGVVLYNTALTATEVADLYANGPGSCENDNHAFTRCVAVVHCAVDPVNAPSSAGNTPVTGELGYSRIQVTSIDTSSYNVNFDVLSSDVDVVGSAAVVGTDPFAVTASATNGDCTFQYDSVEQAVGDTFDDCVLISRTFSKYPRD